MTCIFGFNIGPAASAQGLETNYFKPLAAAGRAPRLMSQNDAGVIAQARTYDAVTAYRTTGRDLENPNYDNYPAVEARLHWARCLAACPPEISGATWLLCENEPDKNSADWLGNYACAMGILALAANRRYAAFGFAGGEPEQEHWETPGMLAYLRLCADHPGQLAIALHEYAYSLDIRAGHPWMIGRFHLLHDVCDRHNIPYPTILITEWGWHATKAPGPNTALDHIRWAQTSVYGPHPNIIMAAIWTLQGGFDPIKTQIQKLITPLGAYAAGPDFAPAPTPAPDPGNTAIDLLDYLFAAPGVTTVLQYNIAGRQGTETHQSRVIDNQDHHIIMRQKGNNAEYWYANDLWIGLFLDTSPVQTGSETRFYTQNTRTQTGDQLGARWVDRHIKIGDRIARAPLIRWHRYSDCAPLAESIVADQLLFIDQRPTCTNPAGWTIDRPCVTLEWQVGGVSIERYTFAHGLGLIEWRELNHNWRSYLVEIHTDRPTLSPPAYPPCFTPPNLVTLCDLPAGPDPAPAPPPDPDESVILRAAYRVTPDALRIRRTPSRAAEILGKVPRDFILIPEDVQVFPSNTIWVRSGTGWLCFCLNGETYLSPWEWPTLTRSYLQMPELQPEPAPTCVGPFTLAWPADFDVVTQPFGANPQVYRRWGLPGHEGLDIAGPNCNRQPIYACAAGTVYRVHPDDGRHNYGTHLRIQHRDGYKTIYAHLSRLLVNLGDQVAAGQIIGHCGSTGNSTGPHLHLTLKREGATAAGDTPYPGDIIDPTPYLIKSLG